jgi:hypothetical protein
VDADSGYAQHGHRPSARQMSISDPKGPVPMKVVAEQPWSWLLFEDKTKLFLSVVCGGVGVHDVDIQLTRDEIEHYSQAGSGYVDHLANSIRAKPADFQSRQLAGFLARAEVGNAVDAWRNSLDAR